jgi:hypothetical protein
MVSILVFIVFVKKSGKHSLVFGFREFVRVWSFEESFQALIQLKFSYSLLIFVWLSLDFKLNHGFQVPWLNFSKQKHTK